MFWSQPQTKEDSAGPDAQQCGGCGKVAERTDLKLSLIHISLTLHTPPEGEADPRATVPKGTKLLRGTEEGRENPPTWRSPTSVGNCFESGFLRHPSKKFGDKLTTHSQGSEHNDEDRQFLE